MTIEDVYNEIYPSWGNKPMVKVLTVFILHGHIIVIVAAKSKIHSSPPSLWSLVLKQNVAHQLLF
jgi:hypothetical protein